MSPEKEMPVRSRSTLANPRSTTSVHSRRGILLKPTCRRLLRTDKQFYKPTEAAVTKTT